ncbi:tetratricopeptide repeat protein [Streptomyces sp. NPDC090306]|uniref:tetratricopeptide repeat protein n=1 Tax=Streptomyces sp. NPDC090306 TaxID=3365961 RepID=UPI00380DA68D
MDGEFVGREVQQGDFRVLLAGVSQRRVEGPGEGHVVLVHGPGGIGKSTLLQRLHTIAQEDGRGGLRRGRRQPRVVFLDWGQGQLKEVVDASPGQGPPLWRVLAAVEIALGKVCGQPAGPAFDAFRTQAAQLPDLVEEAKQSGVLDQQGQAAPVLTPQQVTELVSQLGGLGLQATGLPGSTVVKGVVGSAVTAGGAVQRLRSGKVTREQFQQLIDAKGALVDAFGQGLAAVSRRWPVVIVMDTCELLGEALAELGPLSRLGGNRSVWVVGCRLEDGIRAQDSGADRLLRSVGGDRLHQMGLQVFDDISAGRYLAGRLPHLNEVQRERAVRFSRGLPLALALVVQAVEAGMTVDEVCAPLGRDEGLPSDVVQRLAERYLTHTGTVPALHAERTELMALALAQRTDDPDVLAALWGIPVGDVGATLARLVAHHDFMRSYRRALHDDVQSAVRNLLLRPEERAALREANRRAAACLRKRLRDAPHRSVDEQSQDDTWTADLIALLWHTFWADDQEGTSLLLHLLPPATLNRELPGRLLHTAAFFAPTSPNQTLLNSVSTLEYALRLSPVRDEAVLRARQRLLNTPAPANPVWAGTPPPAVFRDLYAGATAGRVGVHWIEAGALLQRVAAHTALTAGTPTALAIAREANALVPWNEETLDAREREHAIALRRLTARYRDDIDSQLRLGNSNYYARRWQDAEDAYRQALHHDPTNSSAHNGLGHCHAQAGRWDDAENSYRQALHHDPTNTAAYMSLGHCHAQAGRWDDAVDAFRQALHHDPINTAAYMSLGHCHAEAGRWNDAESAFRRALHRDPTNTAARICLGHCHAQAGRWNDAESDFRRALDHDPTISSAHNGLGHCLIEAGRWQDAEDAFRQALRHDPNHSSAHNGLGLLSWRVRGDAVAAQASWSAALGLSPGDSVLQGRVGLARLHEGDAAQAEALLRAEAGDAQCLLLLAVARTRLGRPEEVADLLARAHDTALSSPGYGPRYVQDAFRDAELRALALAGAALAGDGVDGMRAAAATRSKIALFDRALYDQLAVVIPPEQLEQVLAVWREIIAADPTAVGGFGPPPPLPPHPHA